MTSSDMAGSQDKQQAYLRFGDESSLNPRFKPGQLCRAGS